MNEEDRRIANIPPNVIGSVLSEQRRAEPIAKAEMIKDEAIPVVDNGPKVGDMMPIEGQQCVFNGKTWVSVRAVVVDGVAAKLLLALGQMFPKVTQKELEMIEEATRVVWKKFKKALRKS